MFDTERGKPSNKHYVTDLFCWCLCAQQPPPCQCHLSHTLSQCLANPPHSLPLTVSPAAEPSQDVAPVSDTWAPMGTQRPHAHTAAHSSDPAAGYTQESPQATRRKHERS